MKQHTFRRLNTTITSLEMSTWLRISGPKFTVKLDGRCSQYISHQSVEFSSETCSEHFALEIGNRKYHLGLPLYGHFRERRLENLRTETEEARLVDIPSAMVADLLGTARAHGFDISIPESLISVIVYERRLVGWGEDGRPMFADEPANGRGKGIVPNFEGLPEPVQAFVAEVLGAGCCSSWRGRIESATNADELMVRTGEITQDDTGWLKSHIAGETLDALPSDWKKAVGLPYEEN